MFAPGCLVSRSWRVRGPRAPVYIIYIYIYLSIDRSIYLSIDLYICIYINRVCMYMYMYIYTHTYMYIDIYTCIYRALYNVCECVCVWERERERESIPCPSRLRAPSDPWGPLDCGHRQQCVSLGVSVRIFFCSKLQVLNSQCPCTLCLVEW